MLVLASQSPRRAEILRQAGIDFVVRAAPVDESPLAGESPRDYVLRLAEWKAAAVPAAPEEIVLGADTTVVIDGQVLGKPADASDARRMIELLAGRRHEVMTGICLKRGATVPSGAAPGSRLGTRSRAPREGADTPPEIIRDSATTSVWFALMRAREIEAYVGSGEPMDKAGAYAIQGLASKFVERLEGCYFNVMGLPVSLVYKRLGEMAPR